mgnify:CR=1 FL=1
MIMEIDAKPMLKATIAAALALAVNSVAIAQQPSAAAPLMLFFDWGKPDIRSDDQAVLDQAVAGRFSEQMIEPVSMARRQRYLMRARDAARNEVRIKPHLRSKLAFA